MDIIAKNILIAGLGRTGIATADFLIKRGANVIITDTLTENELGNKADKAREMGARLVLGGHKISDFEKVDMIIISPGVPHTILPLIRAKEKRIPVMGEIELASLFIKEPIIAITGTNGKTTTTTLVGEMLKQSGIKTFVGGNIGNPLISFIDGKEKAEIIVCEVSSFQLDTIETFRPKIGVLLNITEDHLDRYTDYDEYEKSKMRIFKNQKSNDIAILNGADQRIRVISDSIGNRKLFFGFRKKGEKGADEIFDQSGTVSGINIKTNAKDISVNISGFNLMGKHNIYNASAACLATFVIGGNIKGINAALEQFKGLPHRTEYIATINGIDYINDSKATNIDAVIKAIYTFNKPITLIMGGRNKGGDFIKLVDILKNRIKNLILIGEAKKLIKKTIENNCTYRILEASSMEEAVYFSGKNASFGDVVLLSPGCSSFDAYNNYAERGRDFREAVKKMERKI